MDINYTVFIPPGAFLENVQLYKYRAVNQQSMCSLTSNHVYLSQAKGFNDPFEATKQFDETKFSQDVLTREIQEAGILCLCQSAQNLAMWSYYGDGLKGFVVGYDLRRLLESLEPVSKSAEECVRRWRYVYEVNYQKAQTSIIDVENLVHGNAPKKSQELLKMFATKSKTFEHENECRVVVPPSPDQDEPYAWSGHGLYQHHPDAINLMVFGELMPEQEKIAICTVMAGRKVEYRRAKRVLHEFRVELVDAS